MTKGNIKESILIIVGNFALALGIRAFILPSGLITGGGTGIALIVQYFTGLDVSITVYGINIIMFILGFKVLGKAFAAKTTISTIIFPTFLAVMGQIPELQSLTDDTLLSAIFAGLLIGGGMGLVLRQGASTGGMDIPPLILNKKTKISVALLINGIDIFILLGQTLFSTIEQVLYGVVVVIITTIVMDKLMLLGESKVQVTIISPKYEEIKTIVYNKINRGCTLINITTGYTMNNQYAVMTVVSNREVHVLNDLVLDIDPTAFIISNTTHSVKGRGFTLPSIDV
ncbi:MAG: YitT family protein [Coprobacillaceae bacterium]